MGVSDGQLVVAPQARQRRCRPDGGEATSLDLDDDCPIWEARPRSSDLGDGAGAGAARGRKAQAEVGSEGHEPGRNTSTKLTGALLYPLSLQEPGGYLFKFSMASSSGSSIVPAFLLNNRSSAGGVSRHHLTQRLAAAPEGGRNLALLWKWNRKKRSNFVIFSKQRHENALQYKKLGDSDLVISEITLGTMTYGEQNTEKEAHEQLSYSFERGINALDTAEVYPVPPRKETQGRTDQYIASWLTSQPRDKVILATKVAGYSQRSSYLRDNLDVVRVDAANIKESVEKSLKRLNTDYIDLLQIHWPDRYVALFGEYFYDPSKWRSSMSFVEQLRGFQELIDQGKVRYIGVSNETSYGVMEFVHAAKVEGLPKIVSIQNNYSLLVRCKFERKMFLESSSVLQLLLQNLSLAHSFSFDTVQLISLKCATKQLQHWFTCLFSTCGWSIIWKYLDIDSEAAKRGRFNLFPGYMERYNKSVAKEVTAKYLEVAKKHGLSLVELALAFARDRPFVTSSIIGATTIDQLKEDIDAFLTTERPLPSEVVADIEDIFKRYKDPAIN
ncbi:protein tas [Sesamum angolense]|uniref:Protein tas n=1 Tax=Sesamum angolense TaxID=2727404 RepID=A0AAE1VWR5_9LAMI|nr:protein tas [Sesamum angolense]